MIPRTAIRVRLLVAIFGALPATALCIPVFILIFSSADRISADDLTGLVGMLWGAAGLAGTALEHLVALAKTDEFFAKPSLVRAIGMYGKSGELYLDELRWMRAEVNRQAELPRLDRSRNLHNSSYSLQVLDEVIDRFEHNIRTEG